MESYFTMLLTNWRSVLRGGVIVVSAVIIIMGMIKKLYDKIENKLLRKFLLALTSVVVVLPVTAVYFVSCGIDYKYFWIDYALLSVATIVTYWLYENTCLRDLIHALGALTVGKMINHFVGRTKENDIIENSMKDLESGEEAIKIATCAMPQLTPSNEENESAKRIRIPIKANEEIAVKPNRSAQKEAEELKKL